MTLTELLTAQLLDPFRAALLVALVVTMLRTEAVTGRWVPLAAGVAFVAAVIPLSMGRPEGVGMAQAVATGVVANLILLAAVLGLRGLWLRARR